MKEKRSEIVFNVGMIVGIAVILGVLAWKWSGQKFCLNPTKCVVEVLGAEIPRDEP